MCDEEWGKKIIKKKLKYQIVGGVLCISGKILVSDKKMLNFDSWNFQHFNMNIKRNFKLKMLHIQWNKCDLVFYRKLRNAG